MWHPLPFNEDPCRSVGVSHFIPNPRWPSHTRQYCVCVCLCQLSVFHLVLLSTASQGHSSVCTTAPGTMWAGKLHRLIRVERISHVCVGRPNTAHNTNGAFFFCHAAVYQHDGGLIKCLRVCVCFGSRGCYSKSRVAATSHDDGIQYALKIIKILYNKWSSNRLVCKNNNNSNNTFKKNNGMQKKNPKVKFQQKSDSVT